MFIDISSMANNTSLNESVTIRLVSDTISDEYGLQTESLIPEIKTNVLVVEKTIRQLDVSTGTYSPRVVYDFYIPTNIMINNDLSGATIVRENGIEYVATSEPIRRKYISHCVLQATERRY